MDLRARGAFLLTELFFGTIGLFGIFCCGIFNVVTVPMVIAGLSLAWLRFARSAQVLGPEGFHARHGL